MLGGGLDRLRLAGLRRELFRWADVPRACFAESDEPDLDVGVNLEVDALRANLKV